MKTRNYFLMVAFAAITVHHALAQNPEQPNDSLKPTIDTLLLEGVTIKSERPLFSVDGEKTLYQVADDPTDAFQR